MAEGDSLDNISRTEIEDFYGAYYDVLDELRLEDWPDFFAEACQYRIISRENYERNLPLTAIGAESRGMIQDRVLGLRQTQTYAPRYYRRFPGPLKLRPIDGSEIPLEHNLLVVQTLVDQPSEIILCARCYDRVTIEDSRLLFKQRDVVFDSEMILNSLIYPA
ncbi:MAG: aromatic-ring-hydroxylating dioxygenase subunit beta [Pseudomonadota bacterium]